MYIVICETVFYLLLIRPRRVVRAFTSHIERHGGKLIPVSTASATAPVPIGRVHNSLFPQLAVFDDRIEYHILTHKELRLSDVEVMTLTNGAFRRSIVTFLPNNQGGHKVDFVMKPMALAQLVELVEQKVTINDERR